MRTVLFISVRFRYNCAGAASWLNILCWARQIFRG